MIRPSSKGCTLSVRVRPGAKQDAITGTHGDALKIAITAAPSEGRANAALIAFLARRLDISRASIEVIAGSASRTKMLHITGITAAEAKARLLSDLA